MDCKKILHESIERELVPLRVRREELVARKDATRDALRDGAKKAGTIAAETMREVRSKMGLGSGAVT
jgi:tryptophanyl-tRNA synthetase